MTAAPANPRAKASAADDALIRHLEAARYNAILEQDYDAFDRLAHPSLIYTHSSGVTDTGGEYLAKCRQGYYVYHQIDHPIDFVRIIDDVALVIGEMNAEITVGGKPKTLRNRCLSVWKLTNGEWNFLAYQPTPT